MFEMDGWCQAAPPQTESPLAMPCLLWFPQEDFKEGVGVWTTLLR